MIERIKQRLRSLRAAASTAMRKRSGEADYARWGSAQSLSGDWDSRTRRIATLIPPGSSVLEFGAGRLVLKACLPVGCSYTPSDLVDRGEGTIICDLNGDSLPPFSDYDVAVFSGVLEYVHDVPRLIEHLSDRVRMIIASYAVKETNERRRRAQGWVNDFSSAQLVQVFETAGFHPEHEERWRSQSIYRFTKR